MKTSLEKQKLGQRGEKLALKYLKKQRYRLLQTNYTTKLGEIDLIMQQYDTVVFVEVKTRHNESFATGEDAITRHKQKHITAAARHFIHVNKLYDCPFRFDVVVVAMPQGQEKTIRHYENAFR